MTERIVHCIILDKDLPGLTFQTYPGDIGKRIYDNVSQEAWKGWMSHQTMLINENRLSPLDAGHRQFIEEEMEKFFFGGGAEKPQGYVPE
jgi:Fe-S cluster biosynthesis and repair protein YggX